MRGGDVLMNDRTDGKEESVGSAGMANAPMAKVPRRTRLEKD